MRRRLSLVVRRWRRYRRSPTAHIAPDRDTRPARRSPVVAAAAIAAFRSQRCRRSRRQAEHDAPRARREGIPHLWLVDPTDRALEAFELHEGQWLQSANAKDDEPVNIRPFDAITFSLGNLWP